MIFQDLQKIYDHTKLINYNILIYGDLNGRIPKLTGDHNHNYLGINKLLPFIENNNLQLLNELHCKNVYTHKTPKGGKSIIDFVLTNKSPNHDNIKIKMEIYSDWMESDHKPIKTQIKFRKINNNNDGNNNNINNDKFFEPTFHLRYNLNDEKNNMGLINSLKQKLYSNNEFMNKINNQNLIKQLKNTRNKKKCKYHINKIYNIFTKELFDALLDNKCIEIEQKQRKSYQFNEIDEDLSNLMQLYHSQTKLINPKFNCNNNNDKHENDNYEVIQTNQTN